MRNRLSVRLVAGVVGAAATCGFVATPSWAASGWSSAASMAVGRYNHTATLLPSGKVLVAGGGVATAELYDPASNSWSPAGTMSTVRSSATATLLSNGKVLVAGGDNASGALSSAELYDPASNTWAPAGPMATARDHHVAALLGSGKVLVASGDDNAHAVTTSELYDPGSNTWSPAASPAPSDYSDAATVLTDGRVLVSGYHSELYEPASNTWSPAGAMAAPRDYHTATLLSSGKVLVAGGGTDSATGMSAELYDPASTIWSSGGTMAAARYWHAAALLADGKLLVAGGETPDRNQLAGAELYDPVSNTWSSAGTMSNTRTNETATLLPSGKVLVAGGFGTDRASAELYTPATSASVRSTDFGDQAVGRIGAAEQVTVTDTGDEPLFVTGTGISGADPGDFSVASDSCSNTTVSPGQTCQLGLRFAPGATGARSATLTIYDNGQSNAQTANLTGNGVSARSGPAGPGGAATGVAFVPSARPRTCIFKGGTDGLRPLPPDCVHMDVKGPPAFSADGRMMYLSNSSAVFARDPVTGALSPLSCQTPNGTRCPPTNGGIVTYGNSLYTTTVKTDKNGDVQDRILRVFDRASDGTLTASQCFDEQGAPSPPAGCASVMPVEAYFDVKLSPDGTSLYQVSDTTLIRFARDPATGRLSLTGCVTSFFQEGCHPNPDLIRITGLAVLNQDAYVDAPGHLVGFRLDPQTGTLQHTNTVVRGDLGSAIVAAPDGREIYATPARDTDVLALARDPATGQLAQPVCFAARSNLTAPATKCPARQPPGFVDEPHNLLAVSPDGQTLITALRGDSGCNHCSSLLPGSGFWNEVVTYRLDADMPVAAGCVGDTVGCGPPIGEPGWLGYAPTGPGPYLVSTRVGSGVNGLQLLLPAPTVHLRRVSLSGRNRASVTCPATRSHGCRGAMVVSLMSTGVPGLGEGHGPFSVTPLLRLRYRLAPGAARGFSLRLDRRARSRLLALAATDRPLPVYSRATAAILIRVLDGTGQTTPAGVMTCLRPRIRSVPCLLGET